MSVAVYSFGLDGQPISGEPFELLPAAGPLRLGQVVWALLFTDARDDQRGGGSWAAGVGQLPGSLLWTLRDRVVTPGLAAEVGDVASDALAWLVAQGIADEARASGEVLGRREIGIESVITRGAATAWPSLWEGIGG